MTTKKLTNREEKMVTIYTLLGVAVVTLIVWLVIVAKDNAKYEAILDVSCSYSYNAASCKQGVKLLKDMTVEEIKDFGL